MSRFGLGRFSDGPYKSMVRQCIGHVFHRNALWVLIWTSLIAIVWESCQSFASPRCLGDWENYLNSSNKSCLHIIWMLESCPEWPLICCNLLVLWISHLKYCLRVLRLHLIVNYQWNKVNGWGTASNKKNIDRLMVCIMILK